MKNISKVLLVAVIALGPVAVVQASGSETCRGRCDTETPRGWNVAGIDDTEPLQHGAALRRWWQMAGADDVRPAQDETLSRGWNVAGIDDTEPLQDGAALRRWWHVAGADDIQETQDSEHYSWQDPAGNGEERETMAAYR